MFSGLFIAYFNLEVWLESLSCMAEENDISGFSIRDYLDNGVSSFRDDFINTGDNDWWIGKWWDYIMYLGFPLMFSVLILSYFADMLANVDNPWDPTNANGISIILLFWDNTLAYSSDLIDLS